MAYEYGLTDVYGYTPREAVDDELFPKLERKFYSYLEARMREHVKREGEGSLSDTDAFDDDEIYAMWDSWIEESQVAIASPTSLRVNRSDLIDMIEELE